MEIYLFAVSLVAIGALLEYWACKIKFLGALLPVALAVGIILFIDADQKHAAELMEMGTMPEALALFAVLLVLVPLLVGMILGCIIHWVKKKKE